MSFEQSSPKKTDLLSQAIERRTSRLSQVSEPIASNPNFGKSYLDIASDKAFENIQGRTLPQLSANNDTAYVSDSELNEGGIFNWSKNVAGKLIDTPQYVRGMLQNQVTGSSKNRANVLALLDPQAAEQFEQYEQFNIMNKALSNEYSRIDANMLRGNIPPMEAERRKREIRAQLENLPTPQIDQELVNSKPRIDRNGDVIQSALTNKELWDEFKQSDEYIRSSFDFEKRFNDSRIQRGMEYAVEASGDSADRFRKAAEAIEKNEFVEAVFEGTKGVGEFAGAVVDTIWNEPGAAADVAGELAVDLLTARLTGIGGLGVSTFAQASEQESGLIEEFVRKNGRLPTQEEARNIGLNTAVTAALDTAGTVGIAKAITPTGLTGGLRGFVDDAAMSLRATSAGQGLSNLKAAASTLANANTASRLATGVASTGVRATTAGSTGALIEGAEGMLAEVSNQTLGKGRTDFSEASLDEILGAGVLEATGGASVTTTAELLKGSGRTARDAANSIRTSANQQGVVTPEVRRQQEQARQTGDMSQILDRESPAFNRVTAMNTLDMRIREASTTPEEKNTLAREAFTLVAETNRTYRSLTSELDTLRALNPEERTSEQANRQKLITKELKKLEEERKALGTSFAGLAADYRPTMEQARNDITALVQAQESTPETATTAERVILSMAITPERFTAEDAEQLATARSITPEQQAYFRVFADTQRNLEALKAEGTLRTFNETIEGRYDESTKPRNTRERFEGINQYRQEVMSYLASGDIGSAERTIADIQDRFLEGKIERLDAIQRAMTTAQETGKSTPVDNQFTGIKTDAYLAYEKLSAAEKRLATPPQKFKPLMAHPSAKGIAAMQSIADTVKAEIALMQAGLNEMQAATDLAARRPVTKPYEVKQFASNDSTVNQEQPVQTNTEASESDMPVADYEAWAEQQNQTSSEPETAQQPTDVGNTDSVVGSETPSGESQTSEASNELSDAEVAARLQAFEDNQKQAEEASQEATEVRTSFIGGKTPTAEFFSQLKEANRAFFSRFIAAKETNEEGVVSDSAFRKLPDLLNRLVANTEAGIQLLLPYAGLEGKNFTENQVNALRDFAAFSKSFKNQLDNFIGDVSQDTKMKEATRELAKEELGQKLLSDNGKLSDVVKDAITIAAYNFILNNGRETQIATEDSIRRQFGLRDNEIIPKALKALVSSQGSSLPMTSESIGKQIADLLGLKEKPFNRNESDLDDADANTQYKRLVSTLGLMATTGLEVTNYTETKSVNLKEVADLLIDDDFLLANPNHWLTAIQSSKGNPVMNTVRMKDPNKNTALRNTLTSNKGTARIMGKIFGVQSERKSPFFSAKEVPVPRTMKRTSQKLVKRVQNIIKKHSERGHSFKPAAEKLLGLVNSEQSDRLWNIVPDTELAQMSKPLRESQEAVNNATRLDREGTEQLMNDIRDRRAQGLSGVFFYAHEMSRQMRLGLASVIANPQANKAVRHLVRQNNWIKDVEFTNTGLVRQTDLAIAAALDIKTDIDSVDNEKALVDLQNKLATPEMRAGVEALIKLDSIDADTLSDQERNELTEASVKAAEIANPNNPMYGLDGLITQAAKEAAQRNNQASFKSDLLIEPDGKTNGVAIGIIQFAGAMTGVDLGKALAKFGIFTSGESSYTNWKRAASHYDAYESIASTWDQKLEEIKANGGKDADKITAIQNIIGPMRDANKNVTKAGRDISKNPTMINSYGAEMMGIMGNFVEDVLAKYYTQIQDTVNNPDLNDAQKRAKLTSLVNSLNTVIDYNNAKINVKSVLADPLNHEVSMGQINAIRTGLKSTYRDALEAAIDTDYAIFKERRKEFNKAFGEMQKTFALLFEQEQRKAFKELGLDPESSVLPSSIRREIEQKLRDTMPILDTILSLEENLREGEQRSDYGIYVGKSSNQTLQGSGHSVSLTRLRNVGNARSTSARYSDLVYTDPGVAPGVLSIHSLDAYVALMGMEAFDLLNVYDGFGLNADQVTKGMQHVNEAFAKAMMDYNMVRQAGNSLQRAINLANQYVDTSSEVAAQIREMEKQLAIVNSIADDIDATKTEAFKDGAYWSNYIKEDGGYDTRTQELKDSFDANLVDDLQEVINDPVTEESTPASLFENDQIAQNPPSINKGLEKLAQTNSKPTVAEFVKSLKEGVGKDEKVLGAILEAIEGIVAKSDIRVVILSKENSTLEDVYGDQAIADALQESFGVYDNLTNTIFLKGTDFNNVGLSTETATHELLHALTNNAIASNPAIQRELSFLLDRLVTPAYNKLSAEEQTKLGNGAPISNVRELLAWGMTNKDFQAFLKTIPAGNNRKFANAWEGFVSMVSKVIFGTKAIGESPRMLTALDRLIDATSVAIDGNNQPIGSNTIDSMSYAQNEQNQADDIHRMTFKEIFNGLANEGPIKLSDSEQNHLREVLTDLVDNIPNYEQMVVEAQGELYTDTDAFLDNVLNDNVPYVSGALASDYVLSNQEAFVLEQVEIATRFGLRQDSDLYKKALALHKAAEEQLTLNDLYWEDLSIDLNDPRNQVQLDTAQRRWDYLFNIDSFQIRNDSEISVTGENVRNVSNYLHKFVSLASVHAPLRDVLNEKVQVENEPNTFREKLRSVVNSLLSVVGIAIGETNREGIASDQMTKLAKDLAGVRVRSQSQMLRSVAENGQRVLDGTNKAITFARKKSYQALQPLVAGNKDTALGKLAQSAAKAGQTVVMGHADQVLNVTRDIIDSANQGQKEGWFGSTMSEMIGRTADISKIWNLFRVAKNTVQQAKMEKEQEVQAVVKSLFNEELTKPLSDALTKVSLRLDLSSLLGDYSVAEITELVESDTKVDAEVRRLEYLIRQQVTNQLQAKYYLAAAKDLGHFVAHGNHRSSLVGNNAYQIASGFGVQGLGKITYQQATQVEGLIDKLATLHGLKMVGDSTSNGSIRRQVSELAKNEANRTDNRNGFEALLRMQEELKAQALEQSFDGDKLNVIKGYTHDVTNPHVAIKQIRGVWNDATNDWDIPKEYKYKGYKVVRQIGSDNKDTSRNGAPVFLASSSADHMTPWESAIFSLTTDSSKGTDVSSIKDILNEQELVNFNSRALVSHIERESQKELKELLKGINYSKPYAPKLTPKFNNKGQVVEYRYLMAHETKDNVLQRRNDIEVNMGRLAMRIVDRKASIENNQKAVEMLYETYREDYDNNRGKYVLVGPNSADPAVREIWDLLPQKTKDHVKTVWGGNEMLVRKDVLTMVFGQRKYAITDAWKKDDDQLTMVEMAFKNVVDIVTGGRGEGVLRRGGKIWKDMVRWAKDIYVIKNVTTLIGNEFSNLTVMYSYGVPMRDMLRYRKEAYNGFVDFHKDKLELSKVEASLRLEQNLDPKQRRLLENQVVRLNDKISKNPVKFMMDAGMFQSIIEDIDMMDDPYTFGSYLDNKIDQKIAKLPEGTQATINKTRDVLNSALLGKGSKGYKALAQLTQASDFIGRYALMKHLTTKADEPLSQTQALAEAEAAFVYYDVPTHRFTQWMNEMGIWWFTKYYFRIQKVLLKRFAANPARYMSMLLMDSFLGNALMQSVGQTSFINGIPLTARQRDPLGVFTAGEEIGTVKAVNWLLGN